MFTTEGHARQSYVELSIETLWLARVIQDGLDILLGNPLANSSDNADRTRVLCICRDVFERLGHFGDCAGAAHANGNVWTAASRTELIRQVAVHWRAFIDYSFGMTCASELIMSLTDDETRILEQVLQLDKEIRANHAGVVFCMAQELQAWSASQSIQRALLRKTYLNSAR